MVLIHLSQPIFDGTKDLSALLVLRLSPRMSIHTSHVVTTHMDNVKLEEANS